MRHFHPITLFLIAVPAVSTCIFAQTAALTGVMGSKALIVVNGAEPKALEIGQMHLGVKLLAVSGDSATVEIKGIKSPLRVGEAPVSLGASMGATGGKRIVLPKGSGGHFYADGFIGGKPQRFMVDTGATTVALGVSDAKRLGIDYVSGKPVNMSTANGVARGWMVKLKSIRIKDVELYEIDAIIGPDMPYALLGNSYLSRFSMNRENDLMVLERRY